MVESFARNLRIPIIKGKRMEVRIANSSLHSMTLCEFSGNLNIKEYIHKTSLNVFADLCADGHDILGQYSNVNIIFCELNYSLDTYALAIGQSGACIYLYF